MEVKATIRHHYIPIYWQNQKWLTKLIMLVGRLEGIFSHIACSNVICYRNFGDNLTLYIEIKNTYTLQSRNILWIYWNKVSVYVACMGEIFIISQFLEAENLKAIIISISEWLNILWDVSSWKPDMNCAEQKVVVGSINRTQTLGLLQV